MNLSWPARVSWRVPAWCTQPSLEVLRTFPRPTLLSANLSIPTMPTTQRLLVARKLRVGIGLVGKDGDVHLCFGFRSSVGDMHVG